MVRELKKGKSLFIYIDGNSGVGGVKKDMDNLLEISLLNKPFFARKGVAFLSHFANVPIIPIICHRDSIEEITIKFFDGIFPSKTDRDTYCAETTKFLYDIFSDYLHKYPDQWEAWLYLHKYLNTKSISQSFVDDQVKCTRDIKMKFNANRYGFIFSNNDILLFDRCTYNSCIIEREMYDILQNTDAIKMLNQIDLEKLINKKIII